jgi:flap endonuclease-1
LENLDKTRYPVPEDWPYQEARELFKKPQVLSASEVEVASTMPGCASVDDDDDDGIV